jgi:hypothetical protein
MDLNHYLLKVEKKLTNWWENGDQKYPLILTSCIKENHEPILDTDNLEKFWKDLDFVMNRRMTVIDNTNYYGVAVPFQLIDFASSAMACALGGKPELLNKETIWCHPNFESLEQVADVELTTENEYY